MAMKALGGSAAASVAQQISFGRRGHSVPQVMGELDGAPSTWWHERTESYKLSSALHTCAPPIK